MPVFLRSFTCTFSFNYPWYKKSVIIPNHLIGKLNLDKATRSRSQLVYLTTHCLLFSTAHCLFKQNNSGGNEVHVNPHLMISWSPELFRDILQAETKRAVFHCLFAHWFLGRTTTITYSTRLLLHMWMVLLSPAMRDFEIHLWTYLETFWLEISREHFMHRWAQ